MQPNSLSTTPNQASSTSPSWLKNSLRHHRPTQLLLGLALLFGLLVLAVALAGNNPSNPKPSLSSQSQLATSQANITITASGFSPQTISIATNTTLTWTNKDSSPHQVAADPYPKNNSIPGFDSTRLLQAGDSYSFSFTKTGTYTYHDQLNPLHMLGTVVVR